jgi:membrane-associated phospholipid phosphatase
VERTALMRPLPGVLAVLVFVTSPTAARAKDAIQEAGDILQYVLPATAAAMTFAYKDLEGSWLFAKSFATTGVTTFLLKEVTDVKRPGRSRSTDSFPSGHASAAFSGASFIQRRYGWRWGLPAYAAASLVAYSRVHADRHRPAEVLAGALIGIGATYLFTKPADEGIFILPLFDGNGAVGLSVRMHW